MTKLEEIFYFHASKEISIKIDNKSQYFKLMDSKGFIEIVTKLVKTDSSGKAFKTIEDLHKYLGVN